MCFWKKEKKGHDHAVIEHVVVKEEPIFDNIKDAVLHILKVNVGEVLSVNRIGLILERMCLYYEDDEIEETILILSEEFNIEKLEEGSYILRA